MRPIGVPRSRKVITTTSSYFSRARHEVFSIALSRFGPVHPLRFRSLAFLRRITPAQSFTRRAELLLSATPPVQEFSRACRNADENPPQRNGQEPWRRSHQASR